MSAQAIRLYIYETFVNRGIAPKISEISNHFDFSINQTEGLLLQLAQARHIVLDDKCEIVMAHPFSSIPLGFSVMGSNTLWWGGCSWDSFALPNLLRQEMVIATTCPSCGSAHAWRVDPSTPPQGEQIAHFLIPTQQMWVNVIHTCSNQRIFCGQDCLDLYLRASCQKKGYVMNLSTLWELSSRWYEGRLDMDYQRRDPSSATSYFREVGLEGEFWGLD